MQVDGKHVLAAVVLGFAWVSALHLDPNAILAPASWAVVSVCVHLAYVVLAGGWAAMDLWGRRAFMWGVFSSVVFLNYLQLDAEFTVSYSA